MRPLLAAALLCSVSTAAFAQTDVTVSREVFSLRDIARTTTPVDASPVSWRGVGQGIVIARRFEKPRRTHLLQLGAATVGNFSYDNGIRRVDLAGTDRFRAVEVRYEYRRYLVTNLVVTGLDVGAALRGGLGGTSLTRTIAGGLESGERRLGSAAALVLLARFRPSPRLRIEAGWANGVHVARATDWHSASPLADRTRWGGGWLTDVNAAASVGLTSRVLVSLRYDQWDDAQLSSHRHLTTRRHSVGVGVTYAR